MRVLISVCIAMLCGASSVVRPWAGEEKILIFVPDRATYYAAYYMRAYEEAFPPDEELGLLDHSRLMMKVHEACARWASAVDIRLTLEPGGRFTLASTRLPRLSNGVSLTDLAPTALDREEFGGRWTHESDVLRLHLDPHGSGQGKAEERAIEGLRRGRHVALPHLWGPFPIPGDEFLMLQE